MFMRMAPTFAGLLLMLSFAPAADVKQPVDDLSEVRVCLRLNAIETAILTAHYEALVKRELGLQDAVRACVRSGDERLEQYQQSLQEARADLEHARKKLVALEFEKDKLIKRLGPQNHGPAAPDLHRTLEKLLERLGSIDKLLEKIERQK